MTDRPTWWQVRDPADRRRVTGWRYASQHRLYGEVRRDLDGWLAVAFRSERGRLRTAALGLFAVRRDAERAVVRDYLEGDDGVRAS